MRVRGRVRFVFWAKYKGEGWRLVVFGFLFLFLLYRIVSFDSYFSVVRSCWIMFFFDLELCFRDNNSWVIRGLIFRIFLFRYYKLG